MAIKIVYYDIEGNHITLNPDGTIEIWTKNDKEKPFIIEYSQSKMLKKMIIAEKEL